MRQLVFRRERWSLARPFAISSGVYHSVDVVVVEISDGACTGRGEAAGVFFRGETAASMVAALEAVQPAIEAGADRAAIGRLMPAGGARNAVDCALWALEAQLAGSTVSALSGMPSVPLTTVATISLDSPDAMARQAQDYAAFDLLKVKLGATNPVECLRAVRSARPAARLIVDVNAGWSVRELHDHAGPSAALGVEMIEQPCAPAHDLEIVQADIPVPLCADESCNTTADLDRLAGHFAMINIKLDKTGGLTEAIALARAARARGFGLMVGNMMGTSLAMAPASLIGSTCRYVDLDGPLLLASDRQPMMPIDGAIIPPLVPAVWG
jgi:L-alanine-DL-glutamate epimerase-like enolase superfamily enzyme